jgi:hypothetical protein
MPITTHRTRILKANAPEGRAILAQTLDGVHSNTRFEIAPAGRNLFRVTIEQVERLPRHKRGITRSVTFMMSRAAVDHLFGVQS